MISENKVDDNVDIGGEQVRTTFRNVAAPEQFEFDEAQWAGQPLPVILSAYREAYGQTVYQVAETLRIRAVYIQYLENGQYSELPGDTYATGFIRTYSTYLGLPVDKMVALYKKESSEAVAAPLAAASSSLGSGGGSSSFYLPKLPILVGAVALAAVFFVGWYFVAGREDPQATPVAGISENLLNMFNATEEKPTAAAGTGGAGSESVTAVEAEEDLFDDGPIVIDATDGEQSSLNDPAEVNAVEAVASLTTGDDAVEAAEGDISSGRLAVADGLAPLPEPKPGSEVAVVETAALTPLPTAEELNGNAEARVVIQATQLAWLQIRKPGDEILLSKVMQPGETQEIPDQSDLRLLTGSIDGLSISVDGKDASPAGPNDGYSVDISLNPDELLAFAN
jgi:cytoskeleton protein RodZ